MDISDRIIMAFFVIFLWTAILFFSAQRFTKAETITTCEELIKANSNTIFDRKNVGKLENCLYTLIEIERNQIPIQSLSNINVWKMRQRLEIHLQWLADRNEQRIEEKNDEFRETR